MEPLGREHTQRVRHALAQEGIELTPDQVAEERKKAYATIRDEMWAMGYEVPDDDTELFLMMHELLKGR